MSKAIVKTTFEASRTLRPIYTGGSTALDASGRLLAACVGEDAVIVDIETGDQLASLEGVSVVHSRALNEAQSADSMYCMRAGWRNYYQSSQYVFLAFVIERAVSTNGHSYSFGFPCHCLLAIYVDAYLRPLTFRRIFWGH